MDSLSLVTQKFGKRLIILFGLAIATLAIFIVSGCGGSTSGTGGVTIQGKLLTQSDSPISGVTVTANNSAAASVTGVDGRFVLATENAPSIGLTFDLSAGPLQASIDNVPSDASVITATFRANDDSISTSDVTVKRRNDDKDPARGDDDDDASGSSSSSSSSFGDDDDDDDNHGGSSSSSSFGDDDDDDSSGSGGSDSGGSGSGSGGSGSADDSSSSGDDSSSSTSSSGHDDDDDSSGGNSGPGGGK